MGSATIGKFDLNQHRINALADTGSLVTIIHLDVFDQIRRGDSMMQPLHQTIPGANNQSFHIYGTGDKMTKLFSIDRPILSEESRKSSYRTKY